MLELMLEQASHDALRGPASPHDHVVAPVIGLHHAEALDDDAMNGLIRAERIRRPLLQAREESDIRRHHVLERLSDAPGPIAWDALHLVWRKPRDERDHRGARRLVLMEEVPYLVLFEWLVFTRHERGRFQLADRKLLGVDVLPVIDRDAVCLEQRSVIREDAPCFRDRLFARFPRRDATREDRDDREEVAGLRFGGVDHRFGHTATHTFCPQSGRSERMSPSTATRSVPGRCSIISSVTPGRTPCVSRYSRNPGSCSNWSGMRSTLARSPVVRRSSGRVARGVVPGIGLPCGHVAGSPRTSTSRSSISRDMACSMR